MTTTGVTSVLLPNHTCPVSCFSQRAKAKATAGQQSQQRIHQQL